MANPRGGRGLSRRSVPHERAASSTNLNVRITACCMRCATCRSASRPAKSWRWWAPMALARRRCCAPSPAHTGRPRAAIRFDGQDVTDVPAHRRVGMGIALVPEGRRLFQQMSVEENLELGRMSGRPGPWTVDKVIETFPNLEARRTRPRRHAVGRRAAGDRDRPRTDEQSEPAAARRSVARPVATCGRPRLSAHSTADEVRRTTIVLVEQDLSAPCASRRGSSACSKGASCSKAPTASLQRERVTEAYFGLGHQQRVSA